MNPLDRRNFLKALAASVIAAGAPLPVGFPTEWKELSWRAHHTYAWVNSIEGQTVEILADGMEQESQLVVDGTVTLAAPASEVSFRLVKP